MMCVPADFVIYISSEMRSYTEHRNFQYHDFMNAQLLFNLLLSVHNV